MVTDKQIKLIIGSLLHDIGKVVYRSGDGRNHSQSGYDYLKDEADIKDIDILNCVRYHHGVYLRKAKIPQNSNAYITYFADNIAAFADRRENENPEDGFDKTIPLDSVFNILNGNNGKSHYAMQVLDVKKEINYPTEKSVRMEDYFYQTIIRNIKIRNLLGMTADIYNEVINSKEEKLSSELVGRINYMKIRFIYEAGREPKVKSLIEEADILQHLKEINGSRKQYILFSHYMEALVAYRKFYGGKDE